MTGERIGYVRVGTAGQNPESQLESQQLNKIFIDKVSGKSLDCPALSECLNYIRGGDTLVVPSMDRLAQNLDDLRTIIKQLTEKGVRVEFIKESLVFTGEDFPMANLLLNVMGAISEFERSLIRERQREGIELAKKKGIYKGRQRTITQDQINLIQEKVALGIPKTKIAKEIGVSRQTIYEYLEIKKE